MNGLEEKEVAHESDRKDEQGEHRHGRKDGVRFVSDIGGAVGNEEHDEDDIKSGQKRIGIGVSAHIFFNFLAAVKFLDTLAGRLGIELWSAKHYKAD